jgi:hypothetical protein
MNKNITLSVAVGILVIFLSSIIWAFAQTGIRAPRFNVSDGNEIQLDSESLNGKVVAGFYENRDETQKNKQLKTVL